MDITKATDTELKAAFYDSLTMREQAQANMNAIDQELLKRRQSVTKSEKPDASSKQS